MVTDRSPGPHGFEFHVARDSRDRYRFDDWLYTISGNVIFANFRAARLFAQRMNEKRDLATFPEQAVKASQINALALIHELTHHMFRLYREQQNPQILEQSLDWLNQQVGPAAVDASLRKFADEFPALAVYRRDTDIETYLAGSTDGIPNRHVVLEEMLMLWIENANPAFAPFQELFDDHDLERETPYPSIISSLRTFFGSPATAGTGTGAGGPGTGRAGGLLGPGENLIDMLLAPARAAPHSLEAQLEFIRGRWGLTLGKDVYRLLGGLDLIKEEEKPTFFGPGPIEIPIESFAGLAAEPEQFSPDRDWMPRLVMLAKNAYVWLDQLAKEYGRPVTTLDQVPDEELDKLQRWGVTGLWLIGLWERSAASQRVKQMMGNPEAVASAYSLFDYQIARRLGGEPACQNLRERAWQRGIRLASDMVPNHVGIDGKWVVEHPDWFLSVPESPYPVYSFNGPDLSWDGRVGIYMEDHYYDRSDAAVVFKRHDRQSGDTRYIYHGNDGTSMPWNDTAQINYLNPEAREGVIQTILHVARQFPVIRFDAAMTLAKRHIQRLWFPEPGAGGAIPSRSEYALSKADFEAAIPHEFWREVVDRVAAEVPDTLLLAEAFWLMEGYFVRTLGMHRVYNSAFMHLLRDEDNAKYRSIMKQTLEFDPEILKRYVNFQNNPDERTAVDQFGKGDKYFGICTVMLTLPGLPMLGHGQVEGFAEKYGMEYQRAYWDEHPDQYLIERHEREIFPLMHKRYLFAEVEHFLLYDFFTTDGALTEDVYAYSNRHGDERALVLYHNKYAEVRGWVRSSAAFSVKTGDERTLIQRTIGEGLSLQAGDGIFYIFRDYVTGLEYLRNGRELAEQGMYAELGAYTYVVFLDWREVRSDGLHQYEQLASFLAGRGVPSVDEAMNELFLQPLHYPFKELVNADMFRRLIDAAESLQVHGLDDAQVEPAQPDTLQPDTLQPDTLQPDTLQPDTLQPLLDEFEQKMLNLLHEIKRFTGNGTAPEPIAREARDELAAIMQLPALEQRFTGNGNVELAGGNAAWGGMFGWVIIHALGKVTGAGDYAEQSRSWIDEWRLGRIVSGVLRELGADDYATSQALSVLKHLTSYQDWFRSPELQQPARLVDSLLSDGEVQQLLRVNRYQGTLWFDKNAFELLLNWLWRMALISLSAGGSGPGDDTIRECYALVRQLQEAAAQSGYQVEKLRALVQA
ncbi:MAG: alpha-amylase [Kouleothrix sp.]|jgi:glycosidase|nr:alpha-amylase [Kouleothrix sp.]